jgi:hypothetical protein
MAIDVTGIDLVKFAQDVYDLSSPQGLGFIHATPAPLADDEARAIVERERPGGFIALSMDYVRGRACKMSVHREGEKLTIPDRWFDHSDDQLDELLARHHVKR